MVSVRASEEGLARVDRARLRRTWTKTRTEIWWLEAEVSQSTLRRFWQRSPIRQSSFIAICKAVGIEQWEGIVDRSFNDDDDLSIQRKEADESSGIPMRPVVLAEAPDGPVDLESAFYIERPPTESRCYETILQPGALIRIKAPRQMGKTSLLERVLNHAQKEGCFVVRINLLQAEYSEFKDLNQFLRWFCAYISYKLKLSSEPKDFWVEDRGSIVNCTSYLQEQVLEQINGPLVLSLDEVDRIFQSSDITKGFFSMLRSWHEEAKTIDVWEQLRLIIAHSTEDYGPLDINLSPFNVGLPIELGEFTAEQVLNLAQRHQMDWQEALVPRLMSIVGGHPYLIRLALFHLAWQDVTLEQLLQDAVTDAGIYAGHLRRHLKTLKECSELAKVFQQVITSEDAVRLETMQAYKLYSMGLVKRTGNCVIPRCQLYREYFQERI